MGVRQIKQLANQTLISNVVHWRTFTTFTKLIIHLYWIINSFTFDHLCFLERIKDIFLLGDKYTMFRPRYFNAQKILQHAQVFHFKFI
jgi:hypothetical protein